MKVGGGVSGPLNHSFAVRSWPTVKCSANAGPTHDQSIEERVTELRSSTETYKYGLYCVTDAYLNEKHNRSLVDAAILAVKGGAKIIQMREKERSTSELVRMGKELMAAVGDQTVVIVNDRIDIALAINAHGVHLGQDDMDCATARALLGPQKIIGISAKTVDQARKAEADGADYLGVGALYSTSTKPESQAIGVEGMIAKCMR